MKTQASLEKEECRLPAGQRNSRDALGASGGHRNIISNKNIESRRASAREGKRGIHRSKEGPDSALRNRERQTTIYYISS